MVGKIGRLAAFVLLFNCIHVTDAFSEGKAMRSFGAHLPAEAIPVDEGTGEGQPEYQCNYRLNAYYAAGNPDPLAPSFSCTDGEVGAAVLSTDHHSPLCGIVPMSSYCLNEAISIFIDSGSCGPDEYICSFNLGEPPTVHLP